ncbi:hypothetical protein PRIPAC_90477 [Pristionchus pacificus]|uniref:Uncharacterized protein n=1 Tax=Pristionchus pacificus TaxID=54126 RepID=A0A2A6B7P7_PRIPA|nr:hypothetical protein PRIPAC_90477 [Pristionchus pacificus]|eukprot:PDM61896.1 hypothetical protein PRIPAC_51338 [Pristionchus pacificus]
MQMQLRRDYDKYKQPIEQKKMKFQEAQAYSKGPLGVVGAVGVGKGNAISGRVSSGVASMIPSCCRGVFPIITGAKITAAVNIVCVAFMLAFVGIPALAFPHRVKVSSMISLATVTLTLLGRILYPRYAELVEPDHLNSDLFIAIVFAIGFAVCCWFFSIYNNCYEYLNNLQRPLEYSEISSYCSVFHSPTTGAQILAVVNVSFAIQTVTLLTFGMPEDGGQITCMAFLILLDLIACALLFIACYEDRAELAALIVALSGVKVCYNLIVVVLCVVGIFYPHTVVPNWYRDQVRKRNTTDVIPPLLTNTEGIVNNYVYFFFSVSMISLLFTILFFLVFYKCYKHLDRCPAHSSTACDNALQNSCNGREIMSERCCCGVLSITAAAQIFAVTMVIGTVEMAVLTSISGAKSEEITPTLAGCLTEIACGILCCIACNKNYSVLMLPIVCFLVARIYFMLLAWLLAIYGLFDQMSPVPHFCRYKILTSSPTAFPSSKDFEAQVLEDTYKFAGWATFDLFLAIWFFNVFINCFVFLEYLERSRPSNRLEIKDQLLTSEFSSSSRRASFLFLYSREDILLRAAKIKDCISINKPD